MNVKILYIPGKENISDFISRNIKEENPWLIIEAGVVNFELFSYSENDLIEKQMNDMEIKEVIEHLQKNYSTIPKSFKKHVSKLNVINNILYYSHHDNLVIVAPKVMRNEIMQLGHSQFYSGHFGAFKTHQRILEDAWWPNMFANIREYIQKCKVCMMVNAENRKKGRLGLREFPRNRWNKYR